MTGQVIQVAGGHALYGSTTRLQLAGDRFMIARN
jgi:hypothetical protein